MSEPDGQAVDRQLVQLLSQLNERGRNRRELGRDVVIGGFLTAIAVSVGWGMWRLDDRSERMFAIVVAERAAQGACP